MHAPRPTTRSRRTSTTSPISINTFGVGPLRQAGRWSTTVRPVLDPSTIFDDFRSRSRGPLTDDVPADGGGRSWGRRLPRRIHLAGPSAQRRLLRSTCPPGSQPEPPWADDHVGVISLAAIGCTADFSLCGELGSAFLAGGMGLIPTSAVYLADCPSAGHDMIALDYRSPGRGRPSCTSTRSWGPPDYGARPPTSRTFISGLVDESDYDLGRRAAERQNVEELFGSDVEPEVHHVAVAPIT